MAETDQEADAFVHDVADMRVPGEVPVENYAQVLYSTALLNDLPTDPYADRWKAAGVLLGTEEKEFSFGCIEFETMCMEPRRKGGEGVFHAMDEGWDVLFDIGHEDLGIVSVMDHMSVRGVQAEVIGKIVNDRGPRTEP